ncbi:MAG: hypothetical protein R3Y62_06925 [Eubacteriales bacterium]
MAKLKDKPVKSPKNQDLPSQRVEEERLRNPIRGRVIDRDNGMQFIPQVSAVRVQSQEYRILIMEDYVPTLGQIEGTITFLTPEGEIRFDDIRGFYKHQHNEFTLLLQQGEAAHSPRQDLEPEE